MRFTKDREEEPRLGIAPLIDVVFLLLIFFMLTSHFDVASGVHVRLPKAAQRIYGAEDHKVILLMDAEGRTYLEGKKLDQEDLKERLKDLVEKKGLVNLILQADENVKHGSVVRVMDLAKVSGVRSIIIAARWDPGKGF